MTQPLIPSRAGRARVCVPLHMCVGDEVRPLPASWTLLFLLCLPSMSHLQNRDFDDFAGLQHMGFKNLRKPKLFPAFAV